MPLHNSKPTDFEVFQHMSENDMDIAGFPDFVSADSLGTKGGKISMGVPNPRFTEFCLTNNKWVAVLFMVDREQFFKLKKEGIPYKEPKQS